jgi:hypothetical protein
MHGAVREVLRESRPSHGQCSTHLTTRGSRRLAGRTLTQGQRRQQRSGRHDPRTAAGRGRPATRRDEPRRSLTPLRRSQPSSPPRSRGRCDGSRSRSTRRLRPRSRHGLRGTSGHQARDGGRKMKLCVDCRFIQPTDDVQQSRCGHILAKRTVTSPVDSSQHSLQTSCKQFRLMLDGCDEDGNSGGRRTSGLNEPG